MSEKQRLNTIIEAVAELREDGQFDAAEQMLADATRDAGIAALEPLTSLGLPRRLQSAMLKLAKARGDQIHRIAYQFHLVPPPDKLAVLVKFTPEEKRGIARANAVPVPRRLHQIWIGDRSLPPTCAAWADHARAHGYDYRLWREADLESISLAADGAYSTMLERGDYPGAVDIARYQVLAREGGIYLDCDWYPARNDISFHDLLPMRGLTALAEDTPRNTGAGGLLLANSMIAAPAGHPVLRRLNAVLGDAMRAIPEGPAWWTTGPLIFTLAARAGAVTIADAGFVVGKVPQDAKLSQVEALADDPASSGLLIAWKSW